MNVIQLQERAKPQPQARPGLVAALDIGSSKICCMIGEATGAGRRSSDPRAQLAVLGAGFTAARGIHSGAVANVVEAEKAIRVAVDAAERQAGRSIDAVFVGLSGGRPQSFCRTGSAIVQGGRVRSQDVDAAVANALQNFSIGSRAILHLAPVGYALDGARSTDAPIGMSGASVSVELGIVTVEHAYLRNVQDAVERAHLHALGYVMAPYAAAHAVLVNDEMKLGTVLVELGHTLTSAGYFNGGHLVAADCIELGGALITGDVAVGLNTSLVHAERLKTLHGSVLASAHDEDELLAVPQLGESNGAIQHVPKGVLSAIIRPRAEEILEHVRTMLSTGGFAPSRMARIVLAGGGASLPGLRELAAGILGRHVRIAEVPSLQGMPEVARQSGFSVATGLLCYGLSPDPQYILPQTAVLEMERQNLGYMRRVGRWLKEAF